MVKIRDVVSYIHSIAPAALQESYDNAGLIVGDDAQEVSGITITLDITEDVIREAIENKDNLIISHHPIIFSGLKRLTNRTYVERCVALAIKNDIALFSAHTNLDNVIRNGVNSRFAEILELRNTKILAPKRQLLKKLTTFIPVEHTNQVMEAVHAAGAGNIGNYEKCSFRIMGTGHFTPTENANPAIGSRNQPEEVQENRVEMIFPGHLEHSVISALNHAHPYEEVAYFLHTVDNESQDIGAGIVGELKEPMNSSEFLKLLKDKFHLKVIKHTALCKDKVHKIALCGGSGSFLLKNAISSQADIFITGDFKYHEFFDAENKIIIADIGHYESETHTKALFFDILTNKFSNIALNFAKTNTNPVKYLI